MVANVNLSIRWRSFVPKAQFAVAVVYKRIAKTSLVRAFQNQQTFIQTDARRSLPYARLNPVLVLKDCTEEKIHNEPSFVFIAYSDQLMRFLRLAELD